MIVEEQKTKAALPRTSAIEPTDAPPGDGATEQRILGLLLADERIYERVKALILDASQPDDDQSDREARALLDRINSGLDEAHARADRLLARVA